MCVLSLQTDCRMEKRGKTKSKSCNRCHVGGTYSTIYRTHPSKTLLSRENDEWQRGKIRAMTRDSGVSSRTATSEEPVEVKCFNFLKVKL